METIYVVEIQDRGNLTHWYEPLNGGVCASLREAQQFAEVYKNNVEPNPIRLRVVRVTRKVELEL